MKETVDALFDRLVKEGTKKKTISEALGSGDLPVLTKLSLQQLSTAFRNNDPHSGIDHDQELLNARFSKVVTSSRGPEFIYRARIVDLAGTEDANEINATIVVWIERDGTICADFED